MAFDAILPLTLFAVVSTLMPEGATTLATASGAQFGFRRSVPLMAGIAAGLASLAAASAAGLAGLLLAWFRKYHFQVTPEIQRVLTVMGFLLLGVTPI